MKVFGKLIALFVFSAFSFNFSVQADTKWNCEGNNSSPIEINFTADGSGKIIAYDFNGKKFEQNSIHPWSYAKKTGENEVIFRFAISYPETWLPHIYFEAIDSDKNLFGIVKNYSGHIELGNGYKIIVYDGVVCKKVH